MQIQSNQQTYIPHNALDGLQVKLTLIKIWDENNIDEQYRTERENYFIQAALVINGNTIYSSKDFRILRKNQAHDEDFFFPVSYKDLSYNSIISITIFSLMKQYEEHSPIASTTFPIFDQNLRLREGKLNLMLWTNAQADISFQSKTPGLVEDENIQSLNFCTQKIEQIQTLNTLQQNTEVNEQLALSTLNLKLLYCYKLIPAAFIEISLPRFPYQVLFEDIEYQYDEHELPIVGGGYSMQNLASTGQSLFSNPNQPPKQNNNSIQTQKIFIPLQNFAECIQFNDFESELQRSDPVTDMVLTVYREEQNPESLKPNQQEEEELKHLMKIPQITDLKSQQSTNFWRYRYWLCQYGEALPKFLNSVQWGNKREEDEAMKLLSKWNDLDIADAIYLLSSFSSSNNIFSNRMNKKPIEHMKKIRDFSVKNLASLTDDKIEDIFLQLVQALKYEVTDINESSLVKFLFERASKNALLASLLYWYLSVETDSPKEGQTQVTQWYKQIFDEFKDKIIQQPGNEEIQSEILSQIQFRKKMLKLSEIRGQKVDRDHKVKELREKLSSEEFQSQYALPEHRICLNMEYKIRKAIPEQATIFKSAMAPMKFSFESISITDNSKHTYQFLYKNGDDLRQDQLVMQIFILMDKTLKKINYNMQLLPYKILACSKSDGFLEFVSLSDTIQDILGKGSVSQYLQKISQDSKNPIYIDICQLNGQDTNTEENQKIIKEYIEIEVKSKGGILPQIMKNYIFSSAGYCVLTYFMGVGDRHLENIMINNEGKMFHIDFGFILGNDPKPFPPPFKLCKEMVEGMGGQKSPNYNDFKKQCIDIYIYLRKDAKLIISLLQLMSDAGIKDYSQIALERMMDKFRLDDTDQSAEIHFLGIVEEAVKSLFSDITDIAHKWASYWRK